jgi:hypothetical protein
MKLWKATFAATLGVLTFGIAFAQTPAPLTADEKLAVRSAQVRLLQANAALQATPQYAAAQAAQQAIQQAVDAVYAKRKITNKDAALCDGPGAGACEKAPAGELTLQEAKEAKK